MAVSAGYVCRNYYRLNGRNIEDYDDYCNEDTSCATVYGAAISYENEYFEVEVKGCFTCKDAYEHQKNSTHFKNSTIYNCYECIGDYCNDDTHNGVATVTASAAVAIPLYLWL